MRGFTRRNLFRMSRFYETYREDTIVTPLVSQLPWSHHLVILEQSKRPEEREFYLRLAIRERWSKRELERQFKTALFERADRVCVLTDELSDIARGILKHTVDAPEILALYHRKVLEASEQLPGSSVAQKAVNLRLRMQELDSNAELPSAAGMQYWLDVRELLHKERSEVRPQAPQQYGTYARFMKAIGIGKMVAEQYWLLGIAWTRSARIRGGNHLHQALMSIIVESCRHSAGV
jgi:DUF1016 N-terminal domain